MGLDTRKPVFGGFQTTNAQSSLRIGADSSALYYSLIKKYNI